MAKKRKSRKKRQIKTITQIKNDLLKATLNDKAKTRKIVASSAIKLSYEEILKLEKWLISSHLQHTTVSPFRNNYSGLVPDINIFFTDFDHDFLRYLAITSLYSDSLAKHNKLKRKAEHSFLNGKEGDFVSAISEHEKAFGKTVWLLETSILYYQHFYGLEKQKEYVKNVQEECPSGVAPFFAYFFGCRNEESFSISSFIAKFLRDTKNAFPSDFFAFLKYHICKIKPETSREILACLKYSEQLHLVDLYETIINLIPDILLNLSSTHRGKIFLLARQNFSKCEDTIFEKFAYHNDLKDPFRLYTPKNQETYLNFLSLPNALKTGDFPFPNETFYDGAPDKIPLRGKLYEQKRVRSSHRTLVEQLANLYANVYDPHQDTYRSSQEIDKHLVNLKVFNIGNYLSHDPFAEYSIYPVYFCSDPIYSDIFTLTDAAIVDSHPKTESLLKQFTFNDDCCASAKRIIHGDGSSLNDFFDVLHAFKRKDHTRIANLSKAEIDRISTGFSKEFDFLYTLSLTYTDNYEICFAYISNLLCESTRNIFHLPVFLLFNGKDWDFYESYVGDIDALISLYGYMRRFPGDTTQEGMFRDLFEEFCETHGIDTFSHLKKLDIEDKKQKYFLTYIASIETLDALEALQKTSEVLDSREKILTHLIDKYGAEDDSFERELHSVTRQRITLSGANKIDSTRIYVDEDQLVSKLNKDFEELFYRSKALIDSGIDSGAPDVEQILQGFQEEKTDSLNLNYPIPDNDVYYSVISIVNAALTSFFEDPAYGLDAHFSLRVRHGSLENTVKSIFIERGFFVSTDASVDSSVGDKWVEVFSRTNETKEDLHEIISKLEESVNSHLKWLITEIIQVNSRRKPNGVFIPGLPKYLYHFIVHELPYFEKSEEFIRYIFSYIWVSQIQPLNEVQRLIREDVKEGVCSAIEEAKAEIQNRLSQDIFSQPNIVDELTKVSTEVQSQLDKIANWFQVPGEKNTTEIVYVSDVIDISQHVTETLHPDKKLIRSDDIEIDVGVDLTIQGHLFDVFHLIFSNSIKHSGLTEINLLVSVRVDSSKTALEINVISDLHSEPSDDQIAAVEAVRDTFRSGDIEVMIREEGLSGMFKLWKYSDHSLPPLDAVQFGFCDNNTQFFTKIIMPFSSILYVNEG